MFTVQAVAKALLKPDVTVEALASALGAIEEKGQDDYRVKADDPSVLGVSLGIPEGKDASAAPQFVQIYYSADHPAALGAAVPGCTDWRMVPNNPSASPYLYKCTFPGSNTHIEVPVYATLTADIKNPAARLQGIILQRNVY